jgi:hypothetical protein
VANRMAVLLHSDMISRVAVLAAAVASAMIAAPQSSSSVVGTISSTDPITINGSATSPSAAPSWPLAAKDEIATTAPALLQTTDRNAVRFDADSKARISSAANGSAYLYVRQGGIHFDARTGPLYICMADRMYIPAKSAQGVLRIDQSGTVVVNLESGTFVEQGTRMCGPDVPPDFLTGLPQAAGGSIGPPPAAGGGINKRNLAIAAAAVAASIGASHFASLSSCATPGGCNFNPASISPSQ